MCAEVSIVQSLAEIARLTEAADAAWVVGGSAGLLLRGLALERPPSDLDLYADEQDAARIHEVLSLYATDKPERSRTSLYDSVLSHYRIGTVQVELVGGFCISQPAGNYRTEIRELLFPAAPHMEVEGRTIALVPLVHELLFNALRERSDRTSLIAAAIQAAPDNSEHVRLLNTIAQRNKLSPALLMQMEAWIEADRDGE
ncbi:nucleotidyltransferase domain-containing protein [Paenibacillus daejeonensis]|uniref:nucleotidyltransferase domain-containing protein n=1 Tax=Paenibacillus daejeonensis TaxID=135193 RepID=UPI00037E6178|nr:hypothetical protein [Paenibacillus daejeonensis]